MKASYASWSRIRKFLKALIVRGISNLKSTINGFLLKMGQTLFFDILKNFHGYHPIRKLFFCSYVFEMGYMPTGSVLQVFLQNVMCCSSLCYF